MIDNPALACLFIGGTADGERIVVNDKRSEHRIASLAPVSYDPHALDDGDPRPETVPVEEIYMPCEGDLGNDTETVFALNALNRDAITMRLVKHFGSDVTFHRPA